MENIIWKKTTRNILLAFLLYSIAGFLSSLFAGIGDIVSSFDRVNYFYDYSYDTELINYWEFLGYMLNMAGIAGHVLFLIAINSFIKCQKDENDAGAVRMIRNSYILLIIGMLVGYLFLVGTIIKHVMLLVSYILIIIGYSRLSHSPIIPEKGRSGASKLMVCAILGLVGSLLGAIPVAGYFIECIMQLTIFIIAIIAWCNLKNNAPAPDSKDITAMAIKENTKHGRALTTLVLTDTILGLTITLLFVFSTYLPHVEFIDSQLPFASHYSQFSAIAFFIYLIVFTTGRRGALQLSGAIIMATISLIAVINHFYPISSFFTYDFETYTIFYEIYNIVYILLTLTSYILLVLGTKVSNMFRITVVSALGINFIRSIISMIILANNDYMYNEDYAIFSEVYNIIYYVVSIALIAFCIIEMHALKKSAATELGV